MASWRRAREKGRETSRLICDAPAYILASRTSGYTYLSIWYPHETGGGGMETYRTEMQGYKRGSQLLFYFALCVGGYWATQEHFQKNNGGIKEWELVTHLGKTAFALLSKLNPVQIGFLSVVRSLQNNVFFFFRILLFTYVCNTVLCQWNCNCKLKSEKKPSW